MVIIPLAALFAVMLLSCEILPGLQMKKPADNLGTLGENSFYAQNMVNEKYYEVKAEKLYEGEKCVIWAEIDSGVTVTAAKNFADEYDNKIRPRIVDVFSEKNFAFSFNGSEYNFVDMLDYANWLTNRDNGKLTILLLDIKDRYDGKKNNSYVAGYFWGGNFYSKGDIGGGHYSNGRDMIYIDTNPGLETRRLSQTYATFAHELQHLISYVTSVRLKRGYLLDVWIDEGLSSQAEYFYLGENPKEKCEWFSEDSEGTIAKGNNFFVWDNHSKESSLALMDDYATVYLFFRWLYLQADDNLKSRIFFDIETSAYPDFQAVTGAAGKINSSWNNWEALLRTWLAANYYPRNSYGYTDDSYLQNIIKVKPIAGRTVSLYPGEGVYSIINNNFNPAVSRPNIRYAGLAANASAINFSPPYRDDVLLTFNANTDNTSASETGSLTSVSPPPPVSRTAAEDTQTPKFNGPYVIDARDMLNRNKR